ncbi:hypothetical protein F7725_024719 [Dissostichus mawsoni]|uniref:Uncharacterized protein n=1 Tax=Dissostichus mawsoni TaxID=36200 RepID=A0A7J5X944_DISMA|nr:hypothetical protein F7725_024719 [Dissostichus mawsoni]
MDENMASLVLTESSHTGSKLDARLKVRLARLQWEKEEREREFQLRRELEIRKLDADTAFRMLRWRWVFPSLKLCGPGSERCGSVFSERCGSVFSERCGSVFSERCGSVFSE